MQQPQSHQLSDWLTYIERVHPAEIEMGVDRIRAVADRAGVLQPAFPIITVGGTNGKGSTVALLRSIYEHAGLRVCSYTSPHLTHFNERVRLSAGNVADDELVAAFASIEAARGDTPLTYFEYTTLAAMMLFIGDRPDITVLEVGMGGRLDAVNIWSADVAVITSIALDHTQWLGADLGSIAIEKAGIARAGKPVVIGEPDFPDVAMNQLTTIGADIRQLGRDYFVEAGSSADNWVYHRAGQAIEMPEPGLDGQWQRDNAAAAITAVRALEHFDVDDSMLAAGIANARLRGRMQELDWQGVHWCCDIAHNLHSCESLAQRLAERVDQYRVAIVNVMADKAFRQMLSLFVGRFDHWIVPQLNIARACDPSALAETLREEGVERVEVAADMRAALDLARRSALVGSGVMIFGSFFTVGEALELMETEG